MSGASSPSPSASASASRALSLSTASYICLGNGDQLFLPAKGVTDEEGRFQVPGTFSGDGFRISARAEGFASRWQSLEPGDQGVEIVLESKALLFLLGTEIDYEISALHAKFVFNNPNATSTCGCGSSFSA